MNVMNDKEIADVNNVIFLWSYITLIRTGISIIGIKNYLIKNSRVSITISGAKNFFKRAGIHEDRTFYY